MQESQWERTIRREAGEEATPHTDLGEAAGKTGIKKTGGLEWYSPKALAQEAKEDLDTRRPVQVSRKPPPQKHHQTQHAVGILWMRQPGKERS